MEASLRSVGAQGEDFSADWSSSHSIGRQRKMWPCIGLLCSLGRIARVGLFICRNSLSCRYYGVKKIRGRRRECSLPTTDRKIAERRHREWITNLQRVDSECERITLRGMLERFVAVNQGRSVKTQGTNHCIIQKMMKTWPDGIDIEVRQIRPSHLDEWLALHEARLKNTSYKSICRVPETAVRDCGEGSNYCGVAVRAGDNAMEETARAHPLRADHRTISGHCGRDSRTAIYKVRCTNR